MSIKLSSDRIINDIIEELEESCIEMQTDKIIKDLLNDNIDSILEKYDSKILDNCQERLQSNFSQHESELFLSIQRLLCYIPNEVRLLKIN